MSTGAVSFASAAHAADSAHRAHWIEVGSDAQETGRRQAGDRQGFDDETAQRRRLR